MPPQTQVIPISAFQDNYIWLIQRGNHCVIVDPGDAVPVLAALDALALVPEAVLITHHHSDHVGGIQRLLARYPGLPVYGPAREPITGVTETVVEGDVVELAGIGRSYEVWEVPGHTAGHIAYLGHGALFCGDTLFACGCGRVFDGTMEDLYASLARIRQLPVDTRVYCAHEYTLDNIGFAQWVEPGSAELNQRRATAIALREAGRPTVPSRIALERTTNPFLRWDQPPVKAAAQAYAGHALNQPAQVFAALRTWKDEEYD